MIIHSRSEKHYSRFEIQKRRFTSDVIVGIYYTAEGTSKPKENRDIVVCPTATKTIGDEYAQFICDRLNCNDSISILEDLVSKGFIGEIGSDAWGNWEFGSDQKPDYDTAVPLYQKKDRFDCVRSVAWRGLYWYFDREGRLCHDDIGCYGKENGGIRRALLELVRTYENLKDDIDPEGFNNPQCK